MKTAKTVILLTAAALFTSGICFAENGPERKNPFREMDADNNGKVSKEEWVDFNKKMFDRIDEDSDGYLSDDELHRFHESHRPPRGR